MVLASVSGLANRQRLVLTFCNRRTSAIYHHFPERAAGDADRLSSARPSRLTTRRRCRGWGETGDKRPIVQPRLRSGASFGWVGDGAAFTWGADERDQQQNLYHDDSPSGWKGLVLDGAAPDLHRLQEHTARICGDALRQWGYWTSTIGSMSGISEQGMARPMILRRFSDRSKSNWLYSGRFSGGD
jgi:hypothetical protein